MTRAGDLYSHPGLRLTQEMRVRHLAAFMLRMKAKHQTLYLMRRYRVWYIDNPRAATVDRWYR